MAVTSIKDDQDVKATALSQRVQEMSKYLLILTRVQDQSDAIFLSSLGNLNMQQLNVLNILGDRGPSTMGEIATCSLMSLSNVTVIVDKLVRLKFVKRIRSDKDRRIVRGELTVEGKKIYDIQINYTHEMVHKVLHVLTNEEQEAFISIFRKLVHAFAAT